MSQDAISVLPSHDFDAGGPIIESRDQRKDSRACIGCSKHVADMDFIEWRLADAENQSPFLFQANVSGALKQVGSDSVGNAGKGAYAARNNNHGISGIGAASDVCTNVIIGLLLDFAGILAQQLLNEIATAAKLQLLGHNPQGAIGGDEVDRLDPRISVDGE
jgi:hypothetical protein